MPQRPGGMDNLEIRQALQALGAVRSFEELGAAVDAVPALSSPTIHAILRQQYLELRNARSPQLASFEPRYRHLFMLLHERQHRALVARVRASARSSTVPPAEIPDPFMPPL